VTAYAGDSCLVPEEKNPTLVHEGCVSGEFHPSPENRFPEVFGFLHQMLQYNCNIAILIYNDSFKGIVEN